MASKRKKADEIRQLFHLSNNWTRKQWEKVNQKGFEFAHDEQLTSEERQNLEEQGMPTFTINRILPVVEMLNFYATDNNPRWQAVGVDGSDSDVAAVMSDLSDYIWHNSNGPSLYTNAINDSITKSLGYMLISVDKDSDNGLGEVIVQQPEPFDVYVDPKSRDMLFSDASFIMIRKVLPKNHLMKLFPDHKRKIANANSDEATDYSFTQRDLGNAEHNFFAYNDDNSQSGQGISSDGEFDPLCEFFEMYEKVKVSNVSVFYRVPPDENTLNQIKQQCEVQVMEMQKEQQVQLLEQDTKMQEAVQKGEMLPERYQLELEKAQQMMMQQLQAFQQECMSKLQSEASKIENIILTEKEYKLFLKAPKAKETIVDSVQFYVTRIKQTCLVGDKVIYEKILPESVKDYPIVPFHYKWTGTPFPMSAVAPLIGKQQEINKSHQIMVHNASLGSSLRWMYEEGSIDAETWEKYSSSPGALLPIRPGVSPPTAVQPAPLSNAFFSIVQQGKQDVEYLAGIYSSMMGDAGGASETYRGMLALDEYGTRRIKQWMNGSIEPALKRLGEVIVQYAQATYTANKRFRIVQPSAIQESREQEINIPIYNDMGEAIGKSMDVSVSKFDIRIVSGSTLPVNRWAYLEELKSLMQMGVVDDIAVLAETDIKNKDKIVQRKSLYAQLQGQLSQLESALKDKDGAIETLERQLVQAGIKGKVMQADVEINKKKEQIKANMNKAVVDTEGKQKLLRNVMANNAQANQQKVQDNIANNQRQAQLILEEVKKDLDNRSKNE